MAKFESGRVQMINSLQATANSEEACSKFWVPLQGSHVFMRLIGVVTICRWLKIRLPFLLWLTFSLI